MFLDLTSIFVCSSPQKAKVARMDNPYNIKINLQPTKEEQKKYSTPNASFPEYLVPNPAVKTCEHGNAFCSKQSAIDRYLVTSDNVYVHDLFPVNDSRNSVCRLFFLDTDKCSCRLPYTGQEDMLLPISTSGDDFSKSKQVFHLISYRLLFDYFFLQMTDGTSTSGYITAFNKKRSLLTGSLAKECCPQIWKWGVRDFECALHTDEVEAFSCSKCPSETSPGDGLDEIHI